MPLGAMVLPLADTIGRRSLSSYFVGFLFVSGSSLFPATVSSTLAEFDVNQVSCDVK